jgi:hypothetical protein
MRGDYSEIVRSQLDGILQDDGGRGNPGKYRECKQALGKIIESIREDLQADPFQDTEEEIVFFKEQAPGIWGHYYLYERLVKIEARRKFQSAEIFLSGLQQVKQKAEDFLEKNAGICEYYYEGRTDADRRLFTRRGTHSSKHPAIHVRIDRDFTIGAHLLSKVRTHELLRDWVTQELTGNSSELVKKLEWRATPTETIEVFKALHLVGCFGDTSFKDVMEWVREALGVDPGKYESTLQNIRSRKISTIKYLERLGKEFKNYIDSKR